jgi:hypothetical protein
MKKINIIGRLVDFFLYSFYPFLFFVLFGMVKIVDGLYLQDFPLLLRAVLFLTGVFFGATLGYVLATVLFDHFFPRYCKVMEEIVNEKRE